MDKALAPVRVTAIALAMVGIFLLLVSLGPIVLRAAESKFWPVAEFTSAKIIERNNAFMRIKFVGHKFASRAECEFIEASARVLNADGEWTKALLILPGPHTTRPPGDQVFEGWEFVPPGSTVHVVARHDCHPWWITVTDLGAWVFDENGIGQKQ